MFILMLSPTLFHTFLERIMTDALEDHNGTVSIGDRTITNIYFVDNIDCLAEEEELAKLVEHLNHTKNFNTMTTTSITYLTQPQIISITTPKNVQKHPISFN